MSDNPWSGIQRPKDKLAAVVADAGHPFEFFWAVDAAGYYLFVWRFEEGNAPPNPSFPDLDGVRMYLSSASVGHDRLFLKLIHREDWEIFASLCRDLLSASRTAPDVPTAMSIMLRRLHRWQEFLRRRKRDLFPEEKIKGLIGELLYLRDHLAPAIGLSNAIAAWRGPFGTPQDFSFGENAIEVKCQSGSTNPTVKITSLEQLTGQLPHLFLSVFTLSRCATSEADAVNLLDLVLDLRARVESEAADAVEVLADALLETGFTDNEQYREFSYKLISTVSFEVKEDFPRITSGSVHPLVEKVSYSIPLGSCKPYIGVPAWISQ